VRSVDSECIGRVKEPRKGLNWGADVVAAAEGSTGTLYWPGGTQSPGVEEQGMYTLGFTQEPGRSCRLRGDNSGGHRETKVQAHRRMASATCGSERMSANAVTAKRRKRSAVGGATGSRSNP
jgi:hypothetical protein